MNTLLKFILFAPAGSLAIVISGCGLSGKDAIKYLSSEEKQYIQIVVDTFRSDHLEDLKPSLDTSVNYEDVLRLKDDLRTYVNHGEIDRQELLGAGINEGIQFGDKSKNRRMASMYNLIEFRDGNQTLAVVTTQSVGDDVKIAGIQFYDYRKFLSSTNFTIAGKSWFEYFFLILCLGTAIFTFLTALLVYRFNPKRRWLWMIFSTVGVCQFSMNWFSGSLSIKN